MREEARDGIGVWGCARRRGGTHARDVRVLNCN